MAFEQRSNLGALLGKQVPNMKPRSWLENLFKISEIKDGVSENCAVSQKSLSRDKGLPSRPSWSMVGLLGSSGTLYLSKSPRWGRTHCKEICGYGFCLMEWSLKGITEDLQSFEDSYTWRDTIRLNERDVAQMKRGLWPPSITIRK